MLALAVVGVFSGAASVSAAPLHPAVTCQKSTLVTGATGHTGGDGSLYGATYIAKWTDNAGTYCGYLQPMTLVYSGECPNQGQEPISYAQIRLYQQSGLYLDGYSWSGLGYATCAGDWYYYGPLVWVTCNSPVHAYGSWLETANSSGENDFGFPAASDGESLGIWSPVWQVPC